MGNFDRSSVNSPLVSIIIPCYNGQNHILEAIESVENQDYQNIEIIIVDDASSDDSVSVVKSYDNFAEITLKRHSENKGISETRNTGVRASEGEYISFIDQDDFWDECKIRKQVEYISKHPNIGIVLTDLREVYKQDGSTRQRGFREPLSELGEKELAEYFFKFWESEPMPITTALYRRSVFDKIGLYDPSLFGANDRDLLIRSIPEYKIGLINSPLVSKRYHSSNASKNNLDMIEDRRRITNKMLTSYPFLRSWENMRRSYLDLQGARELLRSGAIIQAVQPILLSMVRTPKFSVKVMSNYARDKLFDITEGFKPV